jgi:hypothetical protein
MRLNVAEIIKARMACISCSMIAFPRQSQRISPSLMTADYFGR